MPERKRWYIYNGRVWEPDSGNLKAMELCKDLADALAVYALSIQDENSGSHIRPTWESGSDATIGKPS